MADAARRVADEEIDSVRRAVGEDTANALLDAVRDDIVPAVVELSRRSSRFLSTAANAER